MFGLVRVGAPSSARLCIGSRLRLVVIAFHNNKECVIRCVVFSVATREDLPCKASCFKQPKPQSQSRTPQTLRHEQLASYPLTLNLIHLLQFIEDPNRNIHGLNGS